MTIRQLVATICVGSFIMVGYLTIGASFVIGYFVVMAVLGLLATLAHASFRKRLGRYVKRMSETGQQRTLVLLENTAVRHGLAEDLQLAVPRVPLRGDRESFRYPADSARTARWTMYACGILGGFLLLGAVSDLVLHRNAFIDPNGKWWEVPCVMALLAAAAFVMWWSARESRGVLEITDEALILSVPGRAMRRIAWDEVVRAKLGAFPQSIRVWSRTERIAASDALIGYGRAINLIATRLPAGVLSSRVRR